MDNAYEQWKHDKKLLDDLPYIDNSAMDLILPLGATLVGLAAVIIGPIVFYVMGLSPLGTTYMAITMLAGFIIIFHYGRILIPDFTNSHVVLKRGRLKRLHDRSKLKITRLYAEKLYDDTAYLKGKEVHTASTLVEVMDQVVPEWFQSRSGLINRNSLYNRIRTEASEMDEGSRTDGRLVELIDSLVYIPDYEPETTSMKALSKRIESELDSITLDRKPRKGIFDWPFADASEARPVEPTRKQRLQAIAYARDMVGDSISLDGGLTDMHSTGYIGKHTVSDSTVADKDGNGAVRFKSTLALAVPDGYSDTPVASHAAPTRPRVQPDENRPEPVPLNARPRKPESETQDSSVHGDASNTTGTVQEESKDTERDTSPSSTVSTPADDIAKDDTSGSPTEDMKDVAARASRIVAEVKSESKE